MTDESIFAAALAIPSPSQRAAYLDHACAGQPALRREVEALLAAHAADNPLDRPPADLGRTGAYEPQPDDRPAAAVGDRIGPYRLMEQIGEGGFGLVFVAEQSEPVRRKVALKVLKPGMDTRDVVARFEAERQALALMDHPNIARVLDAGSTPAGRPYFVMELVKGVPITDFCDQNKLPPRDRLALFVPVCQAVQHAHQKGIIHRDLKPSNILVTVIDGAAVPKVIDFGVAKAVGQSLTEKTVYTRFAQMIGTPLYMSPEQAELSGVDVDTRADVYALGVLLYELLTGTTPFDRDRFRKAAFDEIRRIIREEEPPRPSTRLSTLGPTLSAVSANRKTDPERLPGIVRGELDWIVMRCLEKDRGRRYETANGLARDVQRYLAGDAVEACPPTVGYRLRKVFRKHKAAVTIAAGFAAVLLLGSVMTAWQAIRATHAEANAARQRDEALASKDEALAAHQAAAAERDHVARANTALRRLATEQRRTLYAISMNLAQAAWETGNPGRTFELLRQQVPGPGEEDLRDFEWHYWEHFGHQDLKTVQLTGFGAGNDAGRSGKLSPDGTRVAAFVTNPTDSATALKLWDAATGKEVWSAPLAAGSGGFPYLEFSRDGRRLVSARNLSPLGERPQSSRVELRVWDTATGKVGYANDFPDSSEVTFPVLSADGSQLALNLWGRGPASGPRLSVRRLRDGAEVFRYPPDKSRAVPDYAVPLYRAFSPDGMQLAAVLNERPLGRSQTLKLWDLKSGREVQTIALPGLPARDVSFSPDGARLATPILDGPNDRIILWDRASGKQLQVLNVPASSGEYTFFYPVVFDPSGKRLAVRQGAQVCLFDADPVPAAHASPLRRPLRGHASWVRDLAFSGNGSRLVTLDEKGVVKQWDPAPREQPLRTPFRSRREGPSVLPSPDGSRIAFVPGLGDRSHSVRLTDGAGRRVGESVLRPGHSHGQAFSLDGRTFALLWHEEPPVGGYTLLVWDAVTGKEVHRLAGPAGQNMARFALSPDGLRIAAFSSPPLSSEAPGSLTLIIWETATGREVLCRRVPHREDVFSPVYSPDGRWLVFRDLSPSRKDEWFVWLDARTGEEAMALRIRKGHELPPDRLAFSRDGRRLAAFPVEGPSSLRVWEADSLLHSKAPEPVLTLTGHGSEITHVEFSPDDRRILTGGGGLVKLWDAASGREVLTLKAPGMPIADAYFSPDGHTIWAGLDKDGHLWGWDGTPVAEAKMP